MFICLLKMQMIGLWAYLSSFQAEKLDIKWRECPDSHLNVLVPLSELSFSLRSENSGRLTYMPVPVSAFHIHSVLHGDHETESGMDKHFETPKPSAQGQSQEMPDCGPDDNLPASECCVRHDPMLACRV